MKEVTHKKIKSERERFELVVEGGETRVCSREGRTSGKSQTELWYYVGLATELGFAVALPLAGGAFFGRYLDSVRGTYPKATLSLLFVGVLLSVVNFFRIVRDVIRKNRKMSKI